MTKTRTNRVKSLPFTTTNIRVATAKRLKAFADRHRLKKIDATDVCMDVVESLSPEQQAAAIQRTASAK